MAGSSLPSPTASFDQSCKYVTSHLFSSRTLAGLRLVLGTYSLVSNIVILVWSSVVLDGVDGYFSYFTHLSYVGLIAWFWASGTQTVVFARASKDDCPSRYPLQTWHRGLQFLHELLFATIATYPIIVTIVYWALISSPDTFTAPFGAWENISQHILNTPFALFEILCTNVPALSWVHLPITIILLGLYLGVAYITYATQGLYGAIPTVTIVTLSFNIWSCSAFRCFSVYDFLDPQKQGALLAGYIVGIALGQAIVFIVIRYVIVLREYLIGGRGERNAAVEVPDGHVKAEEDVIGKFKA